MTKTQHICDRCSCVWEDHMIYSVRVHTYRLILGENLDTGLTAELCELCEGDEEERLKGSPFFEGKRWQLKRRF